MHFYTFFVTDSNILCYSNVKSFKYQHITLISLNRPDDKNRLNVATISDLKKAISNYENDCSSTIAILYGEGGSFCAGFESEELVKTSQMYNVNILYYYFWFVDKLFFPLGFYTITVSKTNNSCCFWICIRCWL